MMISTATMTMSRRRRGVKGKLTTYPLTQSTHTFPRRSKKSIKNSMMHLTNDAVQKKKKGEYGKFEAGNKLSAKELEQYFVEHSGVEAGYVNDVLVPQLREIVKVTAGAVQERINKGKRR